MGRKLFGEYRPMRYAISLQKEYLLRACKDLGNRAAFARTQSQSLLPNVVKAHRSMLLRRLEGVDMRLQQSICVWPPPRSTDC